MKYSDLKLKTNTDIKKVEINGQKIDVLQYLPIEDKIDLIQIALQRAEQNGVYNEMKLDMYFNLYLIELYTNLEFTEEEKANEFLLYNELQSNDVISKIISVIDENEYDSLLDYLDTMKAEKDLYRRSVSAVLTSFIQDMPKNAEIVKDIVNNFDKEKYQAVIDFAKAANNDRMP